LWLCLSRKKNPNGFYIFFKAGGHLRPSQKMVALKKFQATLFIYVLLARTQATKESEKDQRGGD
jgi:hypothetical protein